MTHILIRKMAKELAGMFWDQADSGQMFSDSREEHERSKRFRDTYPTLKDYMLGYQRCRADFAPLLDAEGNPPFGYFRVEHSDRWWKKDRPGWHYFVEHARKSLAKMLLNPSISEHEKHSISKALIEDYNRSVDPKQAEKVSQRRMAMSKMN